MFKPSEIFARIRTTEANLQELADSTERGEKFYAFKRWSQIADQLLKAQC